MKKTKRLLFILMCIVIMLMTVPVSAAEKGNSDITASEKQVKKTKAREGWYTLKNGKKRYFRNGKYVTGLQKIGKWKYYFSPTNGIMQKSTVIIENKSTYFLDDAGHLEGMKKGSKYYDANGKRMSSLKAQDFQTLMNAKKVVRDITTSSMTKSQKLQTCFNWVIRKPYVTRRVFDNFPGWPAVYANDHFVLGGGNCQSDASAFAYLAKALGYKNIFVCVDSNMRGRGHSWTEIGGLVYDPLFAEAKSYSRNYGVKYGVYKLHPILHIKI